MLEKGFGIIIHYCSYSIWYRRLGRQKICLRPRHFVVKVILVLLQ